MLFTVLALLTAQPQSFMPDNDLWRQDCLHCESLANSMTQDLFNRIVEAGRKAYAADAAANNEKLVINALWTNSTVNANCSRYYGKVTVNMYGGLARRDEVNPEGFALVLAHELSHAYGGAPYYPSSNKMSAEGQSDYEGAKTGYYRIAKLVPELQQPREFSDLIKGLCKSNEDCMHDLDGGLSLGKLLATLSEENPPQYETPDLSEVSETETSYPATTQCRLDTYKAGALDQERPRCWYNPKSPAVEPDPWEWFR